MRKTEIRRSIQERGIHSVPLRNAVWLRDITLAQGQCLSNPYSIMPPVIQVSRVRKTYGRTVAVDEVSFAINEGEIFGLIGPNGAGKTTTMECIEGLRTPDRGTISVLGVDPFRQVYQLQVRIGIQLQQAQLQKRIKVWEAVDLWASLYHKKPEDAERLLENLGLTDKRDTWFMNLSGGQKQRLFIALALINDPEVVFLDELTTGLDPQARRAIWDLVRNIRKRGKTVFLTTHLMEEAERLCDRVAIIEHGRIIDIDSPEKLVDRHCPERTIVLVTSAPNAERCFRSIPGVESVARNDSRFTISGRSDDLVTNVIHCLSENHIPVTDFRTILPNLEDVFLKLTGHSIRE
jgi:ABC-2 type transport system ATP-binding protein